MKTFDQLFIEAHDETGSDMVPDQLELPLAPTRPKPHSSRHPAPERQNMREAMKRLKSFVNHSAGGLAPKAAWTALVLGLLKDLDLERARVDTSEPDPDDILRLADDQARRDAQIEDDNRNYWEPGNN